MSFYKSSIQATVGQLIMFPMLDLGYKWKCIGEKKSESTCLNRLMMSGQECPAPEREGCIMVSAC